MKPHQHIILIHRFRFTKHDDEQNKQLKTIPKFQPYSFKHNILSWEIFVVTHSHSKEIPKNHFYFIYGKRLGCEASMLFDSNKAKTVYIYWSNVQKNNKHLFRLRHHTTGCFFLLLLLIFCNFFFIEMFTYRHEILYLREICMYIWSALMVIKKWWCLGGYYMYIFVTTFAHWKINLKSENANVHGVFTVNIESLTVEII